MVQPTTKRLVTEASVGGHVLTQITSPGATKDALGNEISTQLTTPGTPASTALNAAIDTKVSAVVPPAVTSAIAADGTVVSAASAAVGAQVTARNLVGATDLDDPEVKGGLLGKLNRRTWLEFNKTGAPTVRAKSMLGLTDTDQTASDAIGGFIDSKSRRTELVFNRLGQVPDIVLAAWRKRMGVPVSPDYPTKDWAVWGDSMAGTGWVTSLQTLLGGGVGIYGGSMGSQGTRQIAARQNGVPLLVTVPSNVLPQTGAVALTSSTPILNRAGATTGTISGTLLGQKALITQLSNTSYTIEGVNLAGPLTVPPGSPFLTDDGESLRDRVMVLMAFRNSVTPGGTYYEKPEHVTALIQQMIDHISTGVKRVLIVACSPAVGEENGTAARTLLDADNALWKQAFAPYWVDLHTWLQTSEAATQASVTFTADDLTDIANGLVPRVFRSDTLHYSAAASPAIAWKLKQEATLRGWTV